MKVALCVVVLAMLLTGCKDPVVYTLYRSHPTRQDQRIHVATFDVKGETVAENEGNCLTAARLFNGLPSSRVRYWCESGGYRADPEPWVVTITSDRPNAPQE